MSKRIDMTGKRVGRLLVKSYAFTRKKSAYWNCVCDCGNEVVVIGKDLRKGHTQSCGCLQKEKAKDNIKKAGTGNRKTHGQRHTKLYEVWKVMRQRCQNKNNKAYANYGGRGIKVCGEWNDFKNFCEWAINSGYKEGLTLERIDVNGDYEPSNCKWVTLEEQQKNKTNTIYVEINGEAKTLVEWSRLTGIPYNTLYTRYMKGIKGDKLISKEHGNKRAI